MLGCCCDCLPTDLDEVKLMLMEPGISALEYKLDDESRIWYQSSSVEFLV